MLSILSTALGEASGPQNAALSTAGAALPLPAPRVEIAIRPGTMDDLPLVDAMQKKHSRQLGFMHRAALEGKIALGQVLVAEGPPPQPSPGVPGEGARAVGYLIGNDRYKHRDELGVIFQLCVDPNYRRSLVAANLLKAQFERSAWGCKLYCCWCAQDLDANRFYEAMGFVPIAYRAGGAKKGKNGAHRVHIFWQKRIREGDVTTPWWFPSETTGGLMDASRITLPILPGVNWWDELPLLVPTEGEPTTEARETGRVKAKSLTKLVAPTRSGMTFGRPGTMPTAPEPTKAVESKAIEKPAKVKKAPPALASKARELRDKYLEQVNGLSITSAGKYDVARRIEKAEAREAKRLAA